MSRGLLLDTNLLIKAFDTDSDTSDEARIAARQKLTDLLTDDSVAFAITPLIRYELLRHVKWDDNERYEKLQTSIQSFEEFEINNEISEIATGLYQLDAHEALLANSEKNIDKRKFDAFHLASAKQNDLELASDDSDIAKLEPLYRRLIEARKRSSNQENTNNTNNEESA